MATIGWWSKSILPPLNMVEDVADQYKAALGGVHLPAYPPPRGLVRDPLLPRPFAQLHEASLSQLAIYGYILCSCCLSLALVARHSARPRLEGATLVRVTRPPHELLLDAHDATVGTPGREDRANETSSRRPEAQWTLVLRLASASSRAQPQEPKLWEEALVNPSVVGEQRVGKVFRVCANQEIREYVLRTPEFRTA